MKSSKKTAFKVMSISPHLNSLFEENVNSEEIKGDLENKKDNHYVTLNNKQKEESEEYGYELDQSIDNNLNFLNLNKSLLSSDKKPNGEILENNNIIKKGINNYTNKKNKIINSKNNDIYNNGYESEINNNNLKNEYLDTIDERGKKIKRYNNYIKNNNYNNNYMNVNEKIRKSLIIQQILINDMKKEIEYLKLEKEDLQKKFEIQLKNIMKDKNEIIINNEKKENLKLDNGYKNIVEKNINIDKDESDINCKSCQKIIDNAYNTIKQIIKKISIYFDNNYFKDDKIISQNLKDFIKHKNFDNNGIISANDKLLIIEEFNNIIYLEIELLLNYSNNNIEKSLNNSNKKNDNNLSNILDSENGQNNIINNKDNTAKKAYINNKIFKKINTIINKNIFEKANNIKEYGLKRKEDMMNNKNAKYKMINRSIGEKLNNRNNSSNLLNLKSHLLEKNSIVFKSNLSPRYKKDYILNTLNNENFSSKYNKLINKILNSNEKDNKFPKIKNIKFKSNLKELNNLSSNNELSSKSLGKDFAFFEAATFFKNYKRSKIPIPENIIVNKTINSQNIKKNLLSLRNKISNKNKQNENTFEPIYKKNFREYSINNLNNNTLTLDKNPYLSNYKEINFKRKIPLKHNSNNSIHKGFDRNKLSKLEYIKTENNNNLEYIKKKDIFESSNILSNSIIISNNKIDQIASPQNYESTPSKIENKSITSNEKKNKFIDINRDENNITKFVPKIFFKQRKRNKNIWNMNNISMTLNNNNTEKNKEKKNDFVIKRDKYEESNYK